MFSLFEINITCIYNSCIGAFSVCMQVQGSLLLPVFHICWWLRILNTRCGVLFCNSFAFEIIIPSDRLFPVRTIYAYMYMNGWDLFSFRCLHKSNPVKRSCMFKNNDAFCLTCSNISSWSCETTEAIGRGRWPGPCLHDRSFWYIQTYNPDRGLLGSI